MSCQVVRTLIYTYPDRETAERDMANWSIPGIGIRRNGDVSTIYSSCTPMQTFMEDIEALESLAEAARTAPTVERPVNDL